METIERVVQGLSQPKSRYFSQSIPGQSDVPLTPEKASTFLIQELDTPVLDDLNPKLHFFTTPSWNHIDPLHRHILKGREIVVAEDPALHLVWHHPKVFLKPIPTCLMDQQFWSWLMDLTNQAEGHSDSETHSSADSIFGFDLKIAYGFIRSYSLLIQHPSDLSIAIKHGLVPAETTWKAWCDYAFSFRNLKNNQVAMRYHYGQIRLTRLNAAVRILQPRRSKSRLYYHQMYWQTGPYIKRFFGPFLFFFAIISLALASIQIITTTPLNNLSNRNASFVVSHSNAFWVFSLLIFFLLIVLLATIFLVVVSVLISQVSFGIRGKKRAQIKDMV